MSEKISKAIFPIAGLGTRFLPATKAMPKEMLTILDRPVIEWAVIEAAKSGIEEIILDKYAINILFSSNNANNDYKNIIDNTDLLEFNVNDEVKKINIIKTKLHLFQ